MRLGCRTCLVTALLATAVLAADAPSPLNRPDVQQARRLLQAHPWLVSAEVDAKFTEVIASQYEAGEMPGVAVFSACRGLLRRCRSSGVEEALALQPGWPLSSQGSLTQLLACLSKRVPADQLILRAQAALDDVDAESEPDIYGLIRYQLGLGYQERAEPGSPMALDLTIGHFKAALDAWQRQNRRFGKGLIGQAQHNLGRLYWRRQHGNRSQDIETALGWLHKTLENALVLLGDAYLHRVQGERLRNIEQAITYYEQALKQRDEKQHLPETEECWGHWADIEHNLAVAYRTRLFGDRSLNYERARELAEHALSFFDRQRRPEDWSRTAAELATIYNYRQQGDRNANLETAIEYARQALEVYHLDSHPRQWAQVQLTLGNLYCDRISGARAWNDLQAMRCFRRILKRCDRKAEPLHWAQTMNNLGTVYDRHSRCAGRAYRTAIECYRQALQVYTPETLPDKTLPTARNLGALYFRFGEWREAVQGYQIARTAGEALYHQALTEAGKRAEIGEQGEVTHRLAYALAREGNLRQAVVELERGRARLLAETLARERIVSGQTGTQERAAYEQAAGKVRDLQNRLRAAELVTGQADQARGTDRFFMETAEELVSANQELERALAAMRQVPGFEDLLAEPEFGDVEKTLQPAAPLVYLVITSAGGLALVVHPGNIEAIWLNGLTDQALLERVQRWFQAYALYRQATGVYPREQDSLISARRAWFAILEDTTRWLWDAAMGPLVARLQALGHDQATLIPTGLLALLPLHAAWHQEVNGSSRRYVLDDVALAYAPSARVLTYAQQMAAAPGERLFVADNPDGTLRYAAQEVAAVEGYFSDRWVARGEQATRSTALNALPKCDVYHFACHGYNDWQTPLKSALWMFGGVPLTVNDVLSADKPIQARLAFLSACETGLIGADLPDEVVGWASSFIQARAAGVVSTLWPVADESTAQLAERFYEGWKGQGMAPLQALVAAQQWLRDEAEGGRWAHPHYWAAFTLSGT